MNPEAIIRKNLALILGVSLGMVAVNLVVYFLAVARLDKHTKTMQGRVAAVREQLQQMERQRGDTTSSVSRVRTDKQVVENLTTKILQTRAERVVAMQTEILKLVEANHLKADNIGYSYAFFPAEGKHWERGYLKMGIQLPLSGSYQDIKGLLQSLQDSPQFFIVEAIGLSADSQSAAILRVGITLSTYFVATPEDSAGGQVVRKGRA